MLLTLAACGMQVAAPLNAPLTLALDETPSTGYVWQAATGEGLSVLSSTFDAPQTRRVGAPGVRKFLLRAARPGTFTITARLLRPWLGPQSTVRVCAIRLTVTSS